MAERQNGFDSMSGRVTDENTNNNNPNFSNHLAWSQYWQYYYSYYYYYYNAYYHLASSQHAFAGISTQPFGSSAPTNGAIGNPTQTLPGFHQTFLNGGVNGIIGFDRASQPEQRYEYRVAPLGKRIFAEFIDFVFLYFIKYALFLLYYKDPDRLNSQIQYIFVIDDNTTIKDLEDVLVQALMYRLMVFLYEAIFTAVPFPCKIGGATLGKYMMGITVVLYQGLTPIEGYHLRRFSGTASRRLSIWQSCVRATLKNFMITFFFPVIFTTMFLQNFRTPYDMAAKSVVVDAYPKRLTVQN